MLQQGRSFSGLERNCVFLNTRGDENSSGNFANVSAVSGVDFPDDGRALAQVDWDHDGDLDMWISNRNAPRLRFLRNDATSTNDFVQIGLQGNGSDTNRDAVGARVTVYLKEGKLKQLSQSTFAGDGFISQGSRWLHFGLGQKPIIEKVTVRWPNAKGTVETFADINSGGRFELIQGTGVASPIKTNREALAVERKTISPTNTEANMRVPMVTAIDAPELTYRTFEGKRKVLSKQSNEVVLVNLWSTTCLPCRKELKEFAQRWSELQAAGINILAVSIDELGPPVERPVQLSRETAEGLDLPFEVGMAEAEMVQQFRELHESVLVLDRPLPLPTSFLIDKDGVVSVLYKGAISVETLLNDAKLAPRTFVDRFRNTAEFPGRLLNDPALIKPLEFDVSLIYIKLGTELIQKQDIDGSIGYFAKALELVPDSPSAHNEMGVALGLKKQERESIEYLRKAVELDPTHPRYRLNLAQLLESTNQLAEAKSNLEAIVEDLSEHAEAHFKLGMVKTKMNDLEGAQSSYESAVKYDSKNGQAFFMLGVLQMKEQNFAEARTNLEKAHAIHPDQAVILLNLAQVALAESRFVDAEAYALKATQLQSNFADAHYHLGLSRRSLGRTKEARQSFETALQIDRNHVGARRALQ